MTGMPKQASRASWGCVYACIGVVANPAAGKAAGVIKPEGNRTHPGIWAGKVRSLLEQALPMLGTR